MQVHYNADNKSFKSIEYYSANFKHCKAVEHWLLALTGELSICFSIYDYNEHAVWLFTAQCAQCSFQPIYVVPRTAPAPRDAVWSGAVSPGGGGTG